MGSPVTRIALYTSLFAAGSLLACPATGFSAGMIAVGTAVAAIFGNTLASDIHAAFTSGKLNGLVNHDLSKLVGNSLAVLIEMFEKERNASIDASCIKRFLANIRLSEPKLSALAREARKHWMDLEKDITPDGDKLEDHNIVNAFTDHDRTDPTPYVPKEDWYRYLADLEINARTRLGSSFHLDQATRQALSEYIAPRFAVAVRELVKADLDPSVGTGGRVFIGLHLDMMRQLSIGMGRLDTKADEHLKKLESVEKVFVSIRDDIVEKFNDEQGGKYFKLAEQASKEIRIALTSIDRKIDVLHDKIDAFHVAVIAQLNQVQEKLAGISSDSPHAHQQIIQILEQSQSAEDAPAATAGGKTVQEIVRKFASSLATQIAEMKSTENAMNVRFFSIQGAIRKKFELMGVDVTSMLDEIERLREMLRSARFSTGGSSCPITKEQLKALRRNLLVVSFEMTQFPQDLLERAAKHGIYYYQFNTGLSEISDFNRLLPDELANANPNERWKAAAEVGLDPQHDEYRLEALGRMLKTTSGILSLSPEEFSDGFAEHGWISTDDWQTDSCCVMAFGCYKDSDQTSSAMASGWPSLLLFGYRENYSVSAVGCLAARHANFGGISLKKREAGGFWMLARDQDYAYEWDGTSPTPARVWSAPTRATVPIFDVISYAGEVKRMVAVRRRKDMLLDDGDGANVIEAQLPYRAEPRLVFDERNSVLLEVDRVEQHKHPHIPSALVPEYFRVQEPLTGATRFCIRMRIDDQVNGDKTDRPVVWASASLTAAECDPESDASMFVLFASETLTRFDQWYVRTIGQVPLLLLSARSQSTSKDIPESRWLFLIDISGHEPRLFSQPIRTNAQVLFPTVVECGDNLFTFCSLLGDRDLRQSVAGWKLNKQSASWEPFGFWHEADPSKWDLEDGLDIHAVPRGNDADVFYVVRHHKGLEYRHLLYHFCSASRDVNKLIELPKNFKEGNSAILALHRS